MTSPALVVLITGTRHPLSSQHKEIISSSLREVDKNRYGFDRMILVHGNCSGVDKYGAEVAKEMGWTCIPFPADWKRHGKGAGPIRNQQMIDSSHPHVALAFPAPDSKGTQDCIDRILSYLKKEGTRLKSFSTILLPQEERS